MIKPGQVWEFRLNSDCEPWHYLILEVNKDNTVLMCLFDGVMTLAGTTVVKPTAIVGINGITSTWSRVA